MIKTDKAIENPSSDNQPEGSRLTIHDRLRGCLLAGAVGDALGAPVEFMSLSDIRQRFGTDGISDYVPAYGRFGAITDDTQMTLFTAEGLLRAYVRASLRGICSITSVVSHAYLRWLTTQGIKPKASISKTGWLLGIHNLHSRRAPGNTCLSALQAMTTFTDQCARNNSKGAGGIMRVAPVAMMHYGQPEAAGTVFHLGKESAWITHGHPSGYYSAAAFAVILHALLCDETLQTGIKRAQSFLKLHPEADETSQALALGVSCAENGLSPDEALPKIGEAWVGEEALGVAIYCALSVSSLEHGIRMAVNHDGDSDTTGCMVGQLLGATHGESAIPARWLESLELREEIGQLADDLYQHRQWDLDYMAPEFDEAITIRYPGG